MDTKWVPTRLYDHGRSRFMFKSLEIHYAIKLFCFKWWTKIWWFHLRNHQNCCFCPVIGFRAARPHLEKGDVTYLHLPRVEQHLDKNLLKGVCLCYKHCLWNTIKLRTQAWLSGFTLFLRLLPNSNKDVFFPNPTRELLWPPHTRTKRQWIKPGWARKNNRQ